MKRFSFLTILLLLFLAGCQVKSEGGGGVVENHSPTDTKFKLNTTLNKIYSASGNIDFKLTFPRIVTVTGTPRINVTIGASVQTASYLSGDGTKILTFRYTVQPGDNDSNGIIVANPIDLNGGTLKYDSTKDCDLDMILPTLATVLVDTTQPTILSNTGPSPGAYTTGMALNFTYHFSEPVVVTGTPRIPLTVGASTVYANYTSGSGTSNLVFRYTVQAADTDGDGIGSSALTLNGGLIRDVALNNADISHSIPDTSLVILPGNVPIITSVTLPMNGTYEVGQSLNFTVNYNQPVVVTLVPRIAITLTTGTVYADYASGGGTSSLVFTYTVLTGDSDYNGLTMTSPLELNGGAIQNLAMTLNASLLYLPALTPSLKIDGIDPVITSVDAPTAQTYKTSDNVDFIVHYDAPVVVTGTPRITLTVGATPVYANYLSGSGSTSLTFRYIVAVGQQDLDGIAMTSPVSANGGTLVDQFGDNAGLSFTAPDTSGVLVDAVVPVISSVSGPAPGTYYYNNDLDFTVTTSENITVTGTPRLQVTIGSTVVYANYASGSGSNVLVFRYTVLNTDYDNNGIVVASPLLLNGGTLQDDGLNNLTLTFTPPTLTTVLVDGSTASISSITPPANGTYDTGNNLDFTANFTGNVNVTGTPRLQVTIGASTVYANYVSGSGTNALLFRYTVIANDADIDGIALTSPLDLNGGSILDGSSNNATITFTAPNTSAVLVDGVDLVISSVTPPADKTYLNAENLDFIVNFNNSATVTGSPRITLTVGATTLYATYLSGTGTNALTFRYTVGATDVDADGIDTVGPNLDQNGGTIQDAFGDNASLAFTAGNLPNVKVEGSVPTITSVTAPANGTYVAANNLDFTANFSEAIVVTGTPRIALTIGATTKYATYLSGTGTNAIIFRYTVLAGDTDLDGIASTSPLDLNSGTLKDAAGNAVNPLTFTPPNTTAVNVDANVATIIAFTPPANAKYNTSQDLDFSVQFSRNVTVTGTPRITMTVGSSTLYATYTSGSGTDTLLFKYTIVAGDKDTDGIAVASPIGLNGGTILDSNSNAAVLTYTVPNTSAVLVDGIDLVISSITLPADGTYLYNQNMDFTVNFNYNATVTGSPRIILTVGAATKYATYQSGSGSTALVFRYTVGAADEDVNGIDTVGPNLDLNSGSIKDDFYDNANIGFTDGNYPNKKVDGIVPTISSVAGTAPGTYYENENLDFTVTFSESVNVTGSPRIALTIGASTKYATYQSGTGTPVVVFRYTVVSGDVDADGIDSASPLQLNSGTITDFAGNSVNPLTFTPPNTALTMVDANNATILSVTPPADAEYVTTNNLDFTVNYSRPVTVTGTPRIALTVGAATVYANYQSGTGTAALVFRYTVVAGDEDLNGIATTSPIALNGGTMKDSTNNNAVLTFTVPDTSNVDVDGIDLAIASITPPANATYLNAVDMNFTVNYSYAATVAGTPRIQLTVGAATRYATYVSGSGTTALLFKYTVGGTDIDSNGVNTVGPNLDLNSGTIKDNSGDNASLAFTDGNMAGVLVEGIIPTISSVSGPANATYYENENLDFVATFSEAVNITGSPRIALTIGAATRYAVYQSGTGTATVTFRYIVQAGDTDNNGIASSSPLDLNSGTVLDLAGNALNPLTFTPPNTSAVNVDANNATIIAVTPPANATYKTTNIVDFSVQFSRLVNVTGTPRIAVTSGGATVYATYVSGTGSDTLVFRYTITAGDRDIDGIAIASPVQLNSGTIKDSGNANAVLTYTVPNTSGVLFDGIDLAISSVALPVDATYLYNQNFDVTVNYNYAATVTGSPRMQLTVGGATKYAVYQSGTGTTALVFRYTVGATDVDADGIDTVGPNLDLNSGSIKDDFNDNAALAFTAANYPNKKIDGTVPTISSVAAPANGTYTTAQNLDFVATFSEAVNIVGSPRLALTVGAATKYAVYQSGTGTSSVTFRYAVVGGDIDLDGIAVLSPLQLNSGTVKDLSGNDLNPLTFTPPNTTGVIVDADQATIITVTPPANATYKTGNFVDFSAQFTRTVNVTGSPRIAVTVGAATLYANYQSGSGTDTLVFRYTVLAGEKDANGVAIASPIDLNSGTIKDSSNFNAILTYTVPNTAGILIDGIDLVISSLGLPADDTYIYNDNVNFTVNYNYPATVTGNPRMQLTVGASTLYATYVSGTGTTALVFRYTVGAGHEDTDGITSVGPNLDLAGGAIADEFGDNASLVFTAGNYPNKKVDGIVPTISSVTGPASSTYYDGSNLDFVVNFSEALNVTGVPQIGLTVGGVSRNAIYTSGTGTASWTFRYVIQSGDYDNNGIVSISPLDLNSGTIEDLNGNFLSALAFSVPDTSGVNVDATQATIVSVTPPINATYQTSTNLDFSVQFSRTVNVTGTPRIILTVGAATVYANYAAGTGTNTLTFRYTVLAGHSDADGILMQSPISLNSGTIKDTSNANADLNYTVPSTNGVLVDGIDLIVASIDPPADAYYLFNQNVDITVAFNYAATVTGSPRIQLTVGAATRYATYQSGSGTSSHIYRYTVGATDTDADGIDIASTSIDLAGGTIKDAFGDNANIVISPNNFANVQVDGIVPTITNVTGPGAGTYFNAANLDFTVTFSEAVAVVGTPRIGLSIGGNTRYATYTSGTGTTTALFRYTVTSGDLDYDGIQATSPIDLNSGSLKDVPGNNVSPLTFTPPNMSSVITSGNLADAANSTITGTGPVIANGTATSAITITLKDSSNVAVVGVTPTYTATDTGGGNNYGAACTATNMSGVSTCTLKSTKAETKTLSIATPIVDAGGTVVFNPGPAVAVNSTITGTGPVTADGVASSTVTITLLDANNNGVSGTVPTFTATNTGGSNNYGPACSSSNASGVSTCTLKSTKAETKTLSIATPFVKAGGTVVFQAGAAAVAGSSIVGTTPVSADGVSSSIITITVGDAFSNPIVGVTPIFNATGSNNNYGTCTATNSLGTAGCTLSSITAEFKSLQLTSPVAVSGATPVEFSASLPTSANSSITGTTPHIANGTDDSTVTITLKDVNNNAVAGLIPTFDATDTGGGNSYENCSMSDAGGVSVCTMASTKAESKVLRITNPVTKSGSTVVFNPGPAAVATTTIAGSGPVVANGVAVSNITIVIKDAFNNVIAGTTPTFNATNTGGSNVQTACSVSDATGTSGCTLKSTKAESKIPQLLTPVSKAGSTIYFIAGPAHATPSTITGTGPVNPDGVSTSTITITLLDQYLNPVPSSTPTFTATGTNNTYGGCSSSDANGVSTCTLASTTQETKTLSIATPVVKADGTVQFQSGAPVAANSNITGTGPVTANGVATSTITITLKDNVNAPVIGITPLFSATGTSNSYAACSATNASGVSTCTMTSTKAETKTLSITSPLIKADGTVVFQPGPASAVTSTIVAETPNLADGVDECAVEVTILDANNNPIAGVVPTYNMTGTSNTPGACSSTDASGVSLCVAKSTKAEEKVFSLLTPVAKAGNAVDFNPQGINIQVPIELTDRGLLGTTSATTFARTRTTLDPADYVAETNDYFFEAVVDNSCGSTLSMYLVDNAGLQITDSQMAVPTGVTGQRYRVTWTPNSSADNYRVKTPACASGSFRVHNARIIVEQTKAVATKIYMPLLAYIAASGESNSDTTGYLMQSTSITFTQPTASYFTSWTRTDAAYDAIASGTPWTLEVVTSTSNAAGQAQVALYDKAGAVAIGGATTTTTGTAVTLNSVSFASNATNFNTADVMEVRMKSNNASYNARLFKAGLWLKLKYLKKGEFNYRVGIQRTATTGTTAVLHNDGRVLWDAGAWSNPTAYFQTNGVGTTQTIQIRDHGTNDTGTASTAAVTNGSMAPNATYGLKRSAAITLVDQNRYIMQHTRTSGTATMGGSFIIIQATE